MALGWKAGCQCGFRTVMTRWNTDCFVFAADHRFDYFVLRCEKCRKKTRIFGIDDGDVAYARAAHFVMYDADLPPAELIAQFNAVTGRGYEVKREAAPRDERVIAFCCWLLDTDRVQADDFADVMA